MQKSLFANAAALTLIHEEVVGSGLVQPRLVRFDAKTEAQHFSFSGLGHERLRKHRNWSWAARLVSTAILAMRFLCNFCPYN